jgi:uncharacterized protein (DUF924 family)
MNDDEQSLADTVFAFWFGVDETDEMVGVQTFDMWFQNGASYDAAIAAQFGQYLDPANAGAFDRWCTTVRGRLALRVLTDQMHRHVYRGTARAFCADAKAREVCIDGLQREHDVALTPIQRVVYYLSLEHSENLEHQDRCTALFQQLGTQVSVANKERFDGFTQYAVAHHKIIARFGRFPHRSQTLGHPLSDTEQAFLGEPGPSF